MIKIKCPLILASGSPRRKDILQTMGLNFTIDVSDADEDFTGAPDETVMELSLRKAKAVAPKHEDAYVLAADTLVYNGALLGKPGSYEKSIEMLKALRGQWHSVFTGITLIHHRSGNVIQRACETRIHFVDMTDEVVLEAIIEFAKSEGITDLYLLDKEFVKTALEREIARRKEVKNDENFC